jgi:hypothetical protein
MLLQDVTPFYIWLSQLHLQFSCHTSRTILSTLGSPLHSKDRGRILRFERLRPVCHIRRHHMTEGGNHFCLGVLGEYLKLRERK